ncbi:uncharacterized protein LOC143151555 [Ptiloglossa arizonensis]|uniref:uncharacterized protein LOC143151555 n=1 Tax=Ptiloglossa arizonensis TaxID=3350558 RepID=UPI003F9FB5E3
MGRKKSRGRRSVAQQDSKPSREDRDRSGSTSVDATRNEEIEIRTKSAISRGREPGVPIGVCSRLNYPLVRSSLSDSSDESDDDDAESVELNVRPRFVFVASLCAVCSERSKVFCERCRMVSYCSAAHRVQGSSSHRDLCEPLNEIRASMTTLLADESDSRLDAEQYREYRLEVLAILESEIGRPLQLWEKEIVLYPRVCRVCRRFRDDCCPRCSMEPVCEHRDEHEKRCAEFQVLRRCLVLQYKHGAVEPRIPNARQSNPLEISTLGFDELAQRIYGEDSAYYREMDSYTYASLSHLSTIPLTVLHAMQISCPDWRTKTEWTVHIAGAEFQFEGVNLHAWEKLYLHLLPNLKTLRLILVGPELRLPSGVPPKLLAKVKLCSECRSNGKSVIVLFRPERLYHELVRDETERVVPADLICAFNAGLYRNTGYAGTDTWLETIREFCKTPTPLVVTSYTGDEVVWDLARIQSVYDVEVLSTPRRNPFASIKPDRNFVSDDTMPLIYKNYYFAIVRATSPA